jgi:hypothetical protein
MSQESPLVAEIDNQALLIIDGLKDLDATLREQNEKLRNVTNYSSEIKDFDMRTRWDDNVKKLEIVLKEDKALAATMSDIRQLYQTKKKASSAGGTCPPEVLSKLIDRVMEFRKEKVRIKEEMEIIDEEFDDLRKAAQGQSYQPSNREKGAEDRSRFLTQLKYLSPESMKKKPKEFLDYLNNYEAELSKSLMQSQPGTADFKDKMFELGKVSEMKALFAEAQRKKEAQLIRGYDDSALKMPRDLRAVENSAIALSGSGLQGANSQLNNLVAERDKARLDERDEELIRLQHKLAKVNETVRGLDQLNKEKDKMAMLQKEKLELLERDRFEIEIHKLKAEREREEAEHLKRLQRMNMELEYIDQLKSKTIGIVGQQLEEFGKIEENRWANRRMRDREYHQEELNRLQAEFMKREDRRQVDFKMQLKDIEHKYDKAFKLIESSNIDPQTLKLLVGKERQKDFMREAGHPLPESDYTDDDSIMGDGRFNKHMKGVAKKYGHKLPQYIMNNPSNDRYESDRETIVDKFKRRNKRIDTNQTMS